MRTTLTLDDDVAAALERLRRERDATFKEIINETLRRGLEGMHAPRKPRVPFQTAVVSLGRPLIPIDDVSEAIAIAEGEQAK